MKKVIFVGGTSYSGSTLLDMILSNDPGAYSLGEVIALFKPFRKHYLEEREKLLADNQSMWQEILQKGADSLYPLLQKSYGDEREFYVDSSKNPFWIARQTKILKKLGIEVKNVLIYKEKEDLLQSFKKRNRFDKWENNYLKYHVAYPKLIDEFFTISYKELTQNPESSLKQLCQYLEIDWFPEKHAFWQKEEQTTFFGNDRTRYHKLKDKSNIPETADTTAIDEGNDYQKIYYRPCTDTSVIEHVQERVKQNPNLLKIEQLLHSINMQERNHVPPPVTNSTVHFSLSWARYNARQTVYKLFGPSLFLMEEKMLRKKYENVAG